MNFFNLGASELLLIFLLAILAIGPRETLRLARQGSDAFKAVRQTFSELTSEVTRAASEVLESAPEKEQNPEQRRIQE